MELVKRVLQLLGFRKEESLEHETTPEFDKYAKEVEEIQEKIKERGNRRSYPTTKDKLFNYMKSTKKSPFEDDLDKKKAHMWLSKNKLEDPFNMTSNWHRG